MKKFILQVLRRNAYIILAAAWLFTISFIINNYWSGASSIKTLRKDIEERIQSQERDFLKLTMDTVTINKLVAEQYDEATLHEYVNKPYSIFIYQQDEQDGWRLKSWNSQSSLPNNDLLYSMEKNRFIKISNGEYEVIRRIVEIRPNNTLLAVALIPIRKEYFIENPNLKREFAGFPNAEKSISISNYTTEFPVISSFGNTLFYLQSKNVYSEKSTNSAALVLSLLGIVFSLIFIQSLAHSIAEKFGSLTGVAFLFGVVFILRASMYIFNDFFNLRQFDLFDPAIYSSNFILNSLGDLLINTFLVSWVVLFIRKEIGNFNFSSFRNTKLRWPLIILTLFVLVAVTFVFASIIQSLISDASISFDVTNFFSLDQNSFVGFVILATISLSFFFLAQIFLQLLKPLLDRRKYVLYAVSASIGLLLLSFIKTNSFVELNIFVLIWLLAFIWLMQQKYISGVTSRLHISQIIFWIFVFSVSVSAIIIAENNRAELVQRKRTAEKLSIQADPSSERIISIALTYFDNDFLLSNFNRFKIPSANLYLKDSLINKNFGAYINEYDTRIYTFDSSEKNLYNEDPISYDTLNTIFSIEGKKTTVNDLKYFEKSFDKFAYICKKTVIDTAGLKVGYLFILSEPKRYKSDALVPELFKKNNDLSSNEYSTRYSYAVFNEARLVDYSSDYRFPTYLDSKQVPKQEFTELRRNGYSELWYTNNGKVVIIARNDNYLIEAITLFAYLFSTFLLLVALFRIISILVQTRLRWEYLKHYWQFNIRSQIHGTIIFISLFSFLVIGIATIIFFINRYHKNKQDSLSKSIQIIAGEVQKKLVSHAMFDDMVKLYETGDSDYLERLVNEVAENHGMDINIYNLEGDMEVSSHPLVYTKGILSKKMNPLAYYYMHNQRLIQFAGEEQIGGITYQSMYCPVRDENGQPYAYVNIPSFDTQLELKREISNFLVTIINLNAFIFLIAGVIALFITNRITSSFTLIGDKMKEINLGKMNEEIQWRRNDEIGGLVTEYNKMVKKLENSAAALAKSEREGAWREMARQVAHEIKNPLTPMKLSIQYLQKSIDNNSDNVKELSSSVAKTLIEQIDHLSKIAADFSQFANIGNVKMEVFDLHELLQSLTLLYKATENMEFTWIPHPNPVWVMADKTQMNRLFTNLLQNAVEASDEKEFRTISLKEEVMGDMIVIQVTDSGDGIPEAMRSKIFTPNFTTKSSGTGLGLAMSKTIVEQAKGNIWFATVEGEGTTFFVELPIIRA